LAAQDSLPSHRGYQTPAQAALDRFAALAALRAGVAAAHRSAHGGVGGLSKPVRAMSASGVQLSFGAARVAMWTAASLVNRFERTTT